MKIHYLSCFITKEPNSGNPAAVVEDFVGEDYDKQKLAKQLNLPVMVFIEKVPGKIVLRYFYPETEMLMCNHGTLAAAAVLLKDSTSHEIKLFNKENRLIKIRHQDQAFYQEFGKAEIFSIKIAAAEIAEMVGASIESIDSTLPCVVASIGSPKLLVPVKTKHILDSLHPKFESIKSWSRANKVNGLYVYTADEQNADFYARAFNPKTGNNEDAATGVAAGALIGALKQDGLFTIGQGMILSRPSLITVLSQHSNIAVGGKVKFSD